MFSHKPVCLATAAVSANGNGSSGPIFHFPSWKSKYNWKTRNVEGIITSHNEQLIFDYYPITPGSQYSTLFKRPWSERPPIMWISLVLTVIADPARGRFRVGQVCHFLETIKTELFSWKTGDSRYNIHKRLRKTSQKWVLFCCNYRLFELLSGSSTDLLLECNPAFTAANPYSSRNWAISKSDWRVKSSSGVSHVTNHHPRAVSSLIIR